MAPFFRTLIFTIIVPGFWTVLVPYWVVGRGARLELRGVAVAGWLLVTAGVALYLTCAFWGFALRGKGTPAPIDPPKKLVAEGPYAIVRNPMYWSVLCVMLHKFGAEYEAYCRRVPRWIPRFTNKLD